MITDDAGWLSPKYENYRGTEPLFVSCRLLRTDGQARGISEHGTQEDLGQGVDNADGAASRQPRAIVLLLPPLVCLPPDGAGDLGLRFPAPPGPQNDSSQHQLPVAVKRQGLEDDTLAHPLHQVIGDLEVRTHEHPSPRAHLADPDLRPIAAMTSP